MPSFRQAVVVLCCLPVTLLSMSACASMKRVDDASDRNVITTDEIQAANVSTAYDVITKLHANYLHSRGQNSIA